MPAWAGQRAVFGAGDALKPNSRYLFDKLLPNDYALQSDRLGAAELKILVALAAPARTIRTLALPFHSFGTCS